MDTLNAGGTVDLFGHVVVMGACFLSGLAALGAGYEDAPRKVCLSFQPRRPSVPLKPH